MKRHHPMILTALLLAGCKKYETLLERTVTSVEPSGGAALSADGKLALEIPAGALAATTDIIIDTERSGLASYAAPIFDLRPHGMRFALPIAIRLDIAVMSPAVELVNIDGAAPVKVPGSSWDPVARRLTGALTHFSRYTALVHSSTCAEAGPDAGGEGCGGTECTAPQPTCDSPINGAPGSNLCCLLSDACGTCFHVLVASTFCDRGQWRCPATYRLAQDCTSLWSQLDLGSIDQACPRLSIEQCVAQGGEAIADIGGGRTIRDGCPNGRTLIAWLDYGIEGGICCGP